MSMQLRLRADLEVAVRAVKSQELGERLNTSFFHGTLVIVL